MKELIEYRINLLQSLDESAKDFRAECLAAKDPFAPLEENGWNVHQIAVHTRDADKLVYGWRARRTAIEQNPEFQSFDGEAYMTANYDANESLNGLLNGFVQNIEALIELLRALPEEGWSRLSRHSTLGNGLTLQSWVEKDLAHIKEHLEQVKRGNNK